MNKVEQLKNKFEFKEHIALFILNDHARFCKDSTRLLAIHYIEEKMYNAGLIMGYHPDASINLGLGGWFIIKNELYFIKVSKYLTDIIELNKDCFNFNVLYSIKSLDNFLNSDIKTRVISKNFGI